MKKVERYSCKKPCANCPYRVDAPVAHWHINEFKKVLDSELSEFGSTFDCHKKNGSICVGWLMDQRERGLPSIALRISLSTHHVSYATYIEQLKSSKKMYLSYVEMVVANFPELFKKKKYRKLLNQNTQ